MTREEEKKVAEAIKPLIEAVKDGRIIQSRSQSCENWQDTTLDEVLRWPLIGHYRVKPEPRQPRRIWVNEYPGPDKFYRYFYERKSDADSEAGSHRIARVEFVEVLKPE